MQYHSKYGFPLKSYWDTFETSYQHGDQKHRLYALDLLRAKGVESLLDVGCGTGPILEIIRQHGYPFKYKGTDYAQAMVALSKENFPYADFEQQDARHLKEVDNSWDVVLLLHSLDHLDDYQSAIKEATRVAKKYVCIILWRPFVKEGTNLNNINCMGRTPEEGPWEDTHLQEYSREVLEEEFKKNNLTVIHTASGEAINDTTNGTNFLFLLEKNIA